VYRLMRLKNFGAPGEIRAPDRLVRRHASWFVYIYDHKDIFSLLIPNKFPLNRPRWADLAVGEVRLLGTVLHRDVA
jgi:hypothetical protein